MKKANEYIEFEKVVREVLAVPHGEVKKKLDAEKAAKKRKKARRSSASRVASDRK